MPIQPTLPTAAEASTSKPGPKVRNDPPTIISQLKTKIIRAWLSYEENGPIRVVIQRVAQPPGMAGNWQEKAITLTMEEFEAIEDIVDGARPESE